MTTGAIDALHADREAMLKIGTGLTDAEWATASGCPGWSVKDVLAHLGTLLRLLIDPASAAKSHAIGVGRRAPFALGEISGVPGHFPYEGEFNVVQLGDGRFTCTGPMFLGFRMDLGPMAVLEKDGVRVVLASKKCQAADQEMFRHVGIEPQQQRILALKSSVHFRADFEPIAREVLVVAAPGPAKADPTMFDWSRLRPGLRLKPMGPAFVPVAATAD